MVFERTAGRVTSWGGLSGGSQGSRQPSTVGKKQTQPSLSSNQLLSRTSRLGSSCESENGWKTSHGWQGLACRVLKWAVIAKWQSAAACRPSLLSVWQGGCQHCQVQGLLVEVLTRTIRLLLEGVCQWKCVSLCSDSYSVRGNNLSVDHGRLLKTMS